VHALFGVPSLFGVDDALLKLVDQGTPSPHSGLSPLFAPPSNSQPA
jgi:hypothetical protein